MLAFVSSIALLLVMAAVTFFVLLILKTQMHLSSSTFQMTFLAIVVYEGIALFSKPLGAWRKLACWCAAVATYIMLFTVIIYAVGATYFPDNFGDALLMGLSSMLIADELAFVAGGIVQLVLMYHWRNMAQASLATPSSPSCFLLFLKAGFHRTVAGIKDFTPFQGVIIVLLLLNAFLSYRAWDAADEAIWQAADAGQEARSAAHLASDALDAAKEGAELALRCQR